MTRATSLSSEQISAGHVLVFGGGKSWHEAARMVGTCYETLRRQLDPEWKIRRDRQVRDRLNELRLPRLPAVRPPPGKKRLALERKLALQASAETPAKSIPPDESTRDQRRSRASNDAFVAAMQMAIRSKQENPSIGIDKRPSTDSPRFTAARGISHFSSTSSPAGMCADIA